MIEKGIDGYKLDSDLYADAIKTHLELRPVSGATFSTDQRHRGVLWRLWSRTGIFKEYVMFVGLNPSTANQTKNDPTITRIAQFAKRHGYSGFFMTNLFTVISADPAILKNSDVGDQETANMILEAVYSHCKDVVFAWGNFPQATERAKKVIELFPEALCLGKNKNGTPKHPLYVPSAQKLVKF